MKKLVPLFFITLILGCQGQIDQKFEPEPDLEAVMSILSRPLSQLIIVDKSYDIKDTVNDFGVSGALVRIFAGPDTFLFVDSFYDPDSSRWIKQPGGRHWGWASFNDSTLYELQVVYPTGDTVTGETKMPSPINLSWPKDGDTLSISQELANPHPITWNNCLNVGLYTLQCVPNVDTSEYDSFPPFLFIPSFTNDTSYQFFLERAVVPWVYNQEYIVRVNAYGTEYANYVKLGLSGGKANLVTQTGDTCFGVFSGIAIDSVRVYLTE